MSKSARPAMQYGRERCCKASVDAVRNACVTTMRACVLAQDLNLIGDYWGWFDSRSYHHTGMVSMWCAARGVKQRSLL